MVGVEQKSFKEKAKEFLLDGWTSYVSIAAGLLILLAIVGLATVWIIKGRARNMTAAHVLQVQDNAACVRVDTPEKLAFVNGQRNEIVRLGNQHRENAIAYFAYFYATYLVMTIFGLIAAICLAVITKSGVSGSSPHVLATFLISTSIVVLYQASFDILKQKANIDLNTIASVKYAVLADQIDTYCITGKISMKDPNDVLLAALPEPKPSSSPSGQAGGSAQSESSETVK